jgi:hypothetical protein
VILSLLLNICISDSFSKSNEKITVHSKIGVQKTQLSLSEKLLKYEKIKSSVLKQLKRPLNQTLNETMRFKE